MGKLALILNLVFVLSCCCSAQICQQVPSVQPSYAFDVVRVADYSIISARKGFVGKRTGWEFGICDDDGHPWNIVWDDKPGGTQTMLHPSDPNPLLIGFVPQTEGVYYFLFRLTDDMDEIKFAVLMNVKDNTPPKVGWIKKLIGWFFE